MNAAGFARDLLVWGVFPLWVAAGLLDWVCHRATQIERTSGLRENFFHWFMFAQMGAAVVAVVFFQLTAPVLLFASALFLLHEVTVWFELRYTVPKRDVRPFEQMVHSFMELLPLAGLALLAVVAASQATLFDASLALRERLHGTALLAGAAAVFAFNILPLAEESVRCFRATRRTRPRPAPR